MRKFVIIFIMLSISITAFCDNLKIYTESSAPMSFLNEKGELVGAGVEIVKEIQKRVGSNDKIQLLPWARGYRYLQKKKNVLLFSTGRTKQREELFQWIGPIVRIKWALYGKKSQPKLANLEDAKKLKQISTVRQDGRERFLKEKGFTNIHSVSNSYQKTRMVDKDRSTAFTGSNIGYVKVLKAAGLNSENYHEIVVLKNIDLYIAVSKKTDKSIKEKWQKALDEMKSDGSFAKIYNLWLPGEEIPF